MGKKDPLQALVGNGGGILKKLVGFALAIAVLVIVVKFPNDAANWVQGLWGFGEDIIDGLVSFLQQAF